MLHMHIDALVSSNHLCKKKKKKEEVISQSLYCTASIDIAGLYFCYSDVVEFVLDCTPLFTEVSGQLQLHVNCSSSKQIEAVRCGFNNVTFIENCKFLFM